MLWGGTATLVMAPRFVGWGQSEVFAAVSVTACGAAMDGNASGVLFNRQGYVPANRTRARHDWWP